jgi:hypothetical protein
MRGEPQDRKTKNYVLMRSIKDYGMGIVIFGFGLFLAFARKLGFEFSIDPVLRYSFVAMFMVYGAWRMYRGYKKNYFSDND